MDAWKCTNNEIDLESIGEKIGASLTERGINRNTDMDDIVRNQLNLFFFFTATERISMGFGKHAAQKRMVKTRFKDYALRGLVCVWHQMSQKWNKKFPVMSPSLSSQALAIRKK